MPATPFTRPCLILRRRRNGDRRQRHIGARTGSTDHEPDALQLYERNRIERTSRIVSGSGATRTAT